MVMHSALAQQHFMLGIDLHDSLITVPPPVFLAPKPWDPHAVAGFLRFLIFGLATGKPNPTVVGDWGQLLSRTTDIGLPIPHISVTCWDWLCPVYTLAAGSKSHFGAHTVKLHEGSVAAALFGPASINLNCAGASCPPLPLNIVVAPSTVKCGMTWGDIVAGFVHMIVDSAIQYGLNRLWGAAGNAAMRRLGEKLLTQIMINVVAGVIGTFTHGSPLGYSPGYSPIGGSQWWTAGYWIGEGHDALQRAIDGEGSPAPAAAEPTGTPAAIHNYFNAPGVPTFPSTAVA